MQAYPAHSKTSKMQARATEHKSRQKTGCEQIAVASVGTLYKPSFSDVELPRLS